MRNRNELRSAPSQMVLGVLVIAIGLLFLLDNLGIVDFRHALAFWPLAFIVAGVVKLFDTRTRDGYVVGVVLIAVGVTMMLQRLGFFYFSWHTMWPLVMIAVGGLVVFRALTGPRTPVARVKGGADAPGPAATGAFKDGADTAEVVDVTAILGSVERRIVTQTFRGGEVNAILGGCTLDMRGASIEGEAVLNVYALFGGIEIKCPPDWTIVLHGTPILGGFSEKTATPPNTNKRLIIRGTAIMGGVDVQN